MSNENTDKPAETGKPAEAAKPQVEASAPTATAAKPAPAGKPAGGAVKPAPAGKPGGPPQGRTSGGPGGGNKNPRRGPRGRRPEEKKEFDSTILDLARVTRVTKGGKRMRFRTCVIIGDRKGRVGFGVAKGADVQQSVSKASNQARKNLVRVPIVDGTIPHEVIKKFTAAKVLLRPAPKGTGLKAGGAARVVLEMAGVPNVTAKILGSNNKINNAKATVYALFDLKGAAKAVPTQAPPSEGRKPQGRRHQGDKKRTAAKG